VSDFEPPVVMSGTELPSLWLRKKCTCWLTNNLLKGALQSDLRMCTKKTTFYDSKTPRKNVCACTKLWKYGGEFEYQFLKQKQKHAH
jgi:hypothetical protein